MAYEKGKSGNPKGRPKGTGNGPFKQALLVELVAIENASPDNRINAEIELDTHLLSGWDRVILTIRGKPKDAESKTVTGLTDDKMAEAVLDAARGLVHYMETGELTGVDGRAS